MIPKLLFFIVLLRAYTSKFHIPPMVQSKPSSPGPNTIGWELKLSTNIAFKIMKNFIEILAMGGFVSL